MMPKLRPVEQTHEVDSTDPKIERQKLVDYMRELKVEYDELWRSMGKKGKQAKDIQARLYKIQDEVRASQAVILLQGDVDLKLQAEFARDHLGEWIKEMVRESMTQRSTIDRE